MISLTDFFGLSLDSVLKDRVIFWKTNPNYRVTIQCMTVAEGIIMKSECGFGPIFGHVIDLS